MRPYADGRARSAGRNRLRRAIIERLAGQAHGQRQRSCQAIRHDARRHRSASFRCWKRAASSGSEKVGRVAHLPHRAPAGSPIADWVAERRSLMERRLDRLGEILAETDPSPQQSPRKGRKSTDKSASRCSRPARRFRHAPQHLHHRADLSSPAPRACSLPIPTKR